MRVNRSSLRSTVRSVPFAAAAALVLTGCASAPFARVGEYQRAQQSARAAAVMQRNDEPFAPPTQLTRPDDRDYVASAAYWGAQVQANPDDLEASLNFSRNLRLMGGAAQAVSIMKDVVMRDPGNPRVLAEYGKALTAAERPQEAIGFLSQAVQMSPNDWTLLSARGVANDQAGDHAAARADYHQALAIDGDNPTVTTNLALSYVLAGQPAKAEPLLRQAVSRSDATPAMRQNLAMVLALQGKTQEAQVIGQMDLGADEAMSNTRLFAQFDSPLRAAAAPITAPQIEASAKSQIAAVADAVPPPPAVAGDPMATPISAETSAPAKAVSSPRALQMAPVADDAAAAAPVPPVAKPRPVKKPAPPRAPAIAAAPATKTAMPRPVTSNGETLITTINGIPVISDVKPKTKPSASANQLLRGGAL